MVSTDGDSVTERRANRQMVVKPNYNHETGPVSRSGPSYLWSVTMRTEHTCRYVAALLGLAVWLMAPAMGRWSAGGGSPQT